MSGGRESGGERRSVQARRRQLVDVAFKLIAEGGVEAATTRRVASAAGISQASFFYAYPNREALFAELVSQGTAIGSELMVELADQMRARPIEARGTAEDAMTVGFTAYVEFLARNSERERAMLGIAEYASRTPGLADLAAASYARYDAMAVTLMKLVEELYDVEFVEPHETLAPVFVAAGDGVLMRILLAADTAEARRIAETFGRMFLGYLRKPG